MKILSVFSSKLKQTQIQPKKKAVSYRRNMECYSTSGASHLTSTPTRPANSNPNYYENNNYGDQTITSDQHQQHHYYGYHQTYMDMCPSSQQQQTLSQQSVEIVDNSAELWAAQQSCFSLSNDSIHSSLSQPGKKLFFISSMIIMYG